MLVNSYKIIQKIGSGNFSQVFLGEHKKDPHKKAAVKIGQPYDTSIAHESRILRHLNMELPSMIADYVPTLFWYGRFGTNQLSMTMTYYPISLESYIHESNLNTIFSQILSIISYIHSVGILHRDIKLDNFMIKIENDEEHIVLIDFGFACYVDSVFESTDHLVGTPNYTSYFLYEGNPYSRRDDLISTLYLFMELSGIQWPWNSTDADNLITTMKKSGLALNHRLHERNQVRAYYKKKEYLTHYLIRFPILSTFVENLYSLELDEKPEYVKYIDLFQ
jgi:casein kinase 1